MRAIGTESGRTWRANNFLAKTRAADYLFMNPRLRAIVQNFLADRTQINITTLFNALPGETKKSCIKMMACGLSLVHTRIFFATL